MADVGKPRQKLAIDRLELDLRHALADAGVRAIAKGDVLVGVCPLNVQAIGILEHRFVAVGRAIVHDHLFALGDLLAGNLDVAGSRAAHVDHWTDHANELVDGAGDEFGPGDQLCLFAGKVGEQSHGPADGVAGGVVACEDDQQP